MTLNRLSPTVHDAADMNRREFVRYVTGWFGATAAVAGLGISRESERSRKQLTHSEGAYEQRLCQAKVDAAPAGIIAFTAGMMAVALSGFKKPTSPMRLRKDSAGN